MGHGLEIVDDIGLRWSFWVEGVCSTVGLIAEDGCGDCFGEVAFDDDC